MIKYTVGIDLGGTFIKIGLIQSGQVLNFIILPAYSEKGLRSNLPKIKEAVNALTVKSGLPIWWGLVWLFPGLSM